MAIIIEGVNCFDAWHNACTHIANHPNGEDVNMIINVINPCDFVNLTTWLSDYNPKDVDGNGDNIRHVINTIFPYGLRALIPNRFDFYEKYGVVFQKSHNKRWGTYFQRLISFGKGIHPDHPNQLENAIHSLQGNSPQRFFINFHLTASNIESNIKPLGGPCWQFGELIKSPTGSIDLVVVYRNHDYFNKAFGNFIGLAKLLEFICIEAQQRPGSLVVHSIHGYSSAGIPKLRQLIT